MSNKPVWRAIAKARGFYLVQSEPRLIVGHLRHPNLRYEGAEAWHYAAVCSFQL